MTYLFALTLLGASIQAAAQSGVATPPTAQRVPTPVEVVLTQTKVVQGTDGKEQLVAADAVRPGDVLEYRATYTNKTSQPVRGLVANLPIPEGLEYQAGSAKPGGTLVTAATKDGQFAPEPLSRSVNGKAQPVPYNEYRALRWTLGQLPASGSIAVSARARVETVVPPAPAGEAK